MAPKYFSFTFKLPNWRILEFEFVSDNPMVVYIEDNNDIKQPKKVIKRWPLEDIPARGEWANLLARANSCELSIFASRPWSMEEKKKWEEYKRVIQQKIQKNQSNLAANVISILKLYEGDQLDRLSANINASNTVTTELYPSDRIAQMQGRQAQQMQSRQAQQMQSRQAQQVPSQAQQVPSRQAQQVPSRQAQQVPSRPLSLAPWEENNTYEIQRINDNGLAP